MIRLKDAHIGYSSALLIAENLELLSGEVYVLIGQNGSGKSTLLKTLTRRLPLIQGEVLLNGKRVDVLSREELTSLIAFVPVQFPQMDYVRTKEFIGLGRSPHTNLFGSLQPNDLEAVDTAMHALKIEHLKDRFTSELSDGERQLTALAQAVAKASPIILLDEPTAFLDYSNKRKVMELLLDIAKSMNKCIVFSSHDIELSSDRFDNFLVAKKREQTLQLMQSVSKEELIAEAYPE